MTMSVMQVGIMRVLVEHRAVPMPMRVGFIGRNVWPVLVLVMGIVNVAMFMFDPLVRMLVLV